MTKFRVGDLVYWWPDGDDAAAATREEWEIERIGDNGRLEVKLRGTKAEHFVTGEPGFFRLVHKRKPHALFWVDLETTGLAPQSAEILEIAYAVTTFDRFDATDQHGKLLVQGPASSKIRCGDQNWGDDFIRDMHARSGLTADMTLASKSLPGWASFSGYRFDTIVAHEHALLGLSADWPTEDKDEKVVIAGSSAHFDLSFLRFYMPSFVKRLSHRVFDTSAVEMFARTLGYEPPSRGEPKHRAADDLAGSMQIARDVAAWLEGRRQT